MQTSKSYTLQSKIEILNEYVPNVRGNGITAIARRHSIPTSVIQDWVKCKERILQAANKPECDVRNTRKLGTGRQKRFGELEEMILDWIEIRNKAGLRI